MGTAPRVLNKYTDEIPHDAICCMRPGILGNPFVIGRDGSRDVVVRKHRRWLRRRPDLRQLVESLAGRDLVCCCAPAPCHCDIYLRLANGSKRLRDKFWSIRAK